MEITRQQKLRLGIFVVGVAAILAAIVFYMVGRRLIQKYDAYYTRFEESVDGLNPGANVKLNGVVVGRVTKLEVDPEDVSKVIAYFEVRHGTPIKVDMRANLTGGLTITGLKTIELVGGSSDSPDLKTGSELPAGMSQLKALTGQAEVIAIKLESLLNNLLALSAPENMANLTSLLDALSEITGNLNTLVATNRETLEELPDRTALALTEVQQAAAEAKELVAEFRLQRPGEKLGETLESFRVASKSIEDMLKNADVERTLVTFEDAAAKIGSAAAKFDHALMVIKDDLATSMRYIKETSENMADFSREIRDNPSLLLRRENKQERSQ